MPAAPKPKNEKERVQALEGYDVLDSLPEKEYDDIVKLASFICDTPIALVSLVDEDRQWFKAKKGVDVNETPRELAFCAHAILSPDKPLIVEDATKDSRFSDNDLVNIDPKIRFYAGYPLNTPCGYPIGTLCTIDTKPKQISDEQIAALKVLASNISSLLELRKSHIEQKELIRKLRHSNEELERFAHIASHDIQEPLRTIANFTSLLKKKYSQNIDETGHKYLEIATNSATKMQHLVNDLLDYAKVNQETEANEKFYIEDTINFVKSSLSTLIKESNAEITFDKTPLIYAKPIRISRVLQNLIVNSIRYRKKDIPPKIHLHVEQNNDFWEFCLEDNGIGMNPENCTEIFLPLKRLHSRKKYDGSGIGLAICKRLVKSMGGEIWADSEPDHGSKFYFTIPKVKKDSK